MFWRRRMWDRVGASFDANLQFAMDWDLIFRFLDAGAVFHYVPELFGVFSAHGNQKSQASFRSWRKGWLVCVRVTVVRT